jgi:hypothetical protein
VQALLTDGSAAITTLPMWPLRRWELPAVLRPTAGETGEVRIDLQFAGISAEGVPVIVRSITNGFEARIIANVPTLLPAGDYEAHTEQLMLFMEQDHDEATFTVTSGSRQTVVLARSEARRPVVVTACMTDDRAATAAAIEVEIPGIGSAHFITQAVDFPLTLWLPVGALTINAIAPHAIKATQSLEIFADKPVPPIHLTMQGALRWDR